MKEFVKNISYIILIVLFLILSINVSYNHGKLKGFELYEEITKQNSTEETYNHTLTSVIFDTVYLDKYIPYYETDTLYLTDTITDTITDTLILKDTIYLPNQVSIKDTTFVDSINNQIVSNELHIQLSGYQTSIDTLRLKTSITSIKQNSKWYNNLVPAIGVGVGINKKVGVFIGIGYRF
jgi:hypothetical protein